MKKQKFCNQGLIPAMAFAILGFTASCSDDELKTTTGGGSDANEPETTQIDATPMAMITDQNILAEYVTNYSRASRAATADYKSWEEYVKEINTSLEAALDKYEDIEIPEDFAGIVELTSLDFMNGYTTEAGKNATTFVLSEGTVSGNVTVKTSPTTVYVRSGAKLTIGSCGDNNKGLNVIVLNGGEVEINGSQFWGKIYSFSSKPMIHSNDCSVNGTIIANEVKATGAAKYENSNCNVYVQKFTGSDIQVNSPANVVIGCSTLSGTLKVDSNTFYTEFGGTFNKVELGATGNLNMANGAIVRTYTDFNLRQSDGRVTVVQIANKPSDYAVIQSETSAGAKSTITLNTKEAFGAQFGDSYVILYGTINHEGGGGAATTPPNVIIDDNKEYYVPSSGCGSAYGTAPAAEAFPEFVNIADIDPRVHTHPISATCIAVNGNEAYVSWHLRGGNVWGCVEKISVDGTTDAVTLDAWMETPAYLAYSDANDEYQTVSGKEYDAIKAHGEDRDLAYDFNHLIYHNGYLLLVGDHDRKGGFIGRINTADIASAGDDFTGNEMSIFTARQLGKDNSTVDTDGNVTADVVAGRSGNSVIVGKDADGTEELWIVSRGGYQIMDYADNGANFSVKSIKVDGQGWVSWSPWKDAMTTKNSVKHIAQSSTGSIATIEYVEAAPTDEEYMWWNDNATQLAAQIKIWDNPWAFGLDIEPKSTIDVAAFGPIYGKNVIAFDTDGYLYSCQGWNGVVKYDTAGKEVKSVNIPEWMDANYDKLKKETATNTKNPNPNRYRGSAANGLSIFGDKVYVANGGAGVWELAKSDLTPVRYFMNDEAASANYVQPLTANGNDYLVVAYGRAGIRVFKL